MSIISHVILVTDVPQAAQAVIERWKQGLKDRADRIIANSRARIPDATAFNDLLATASIKGWKDVINPAFFSRAGLKASEIRDSQQANISRSYEKYRDQLEFLFETVDGIPAKRFKELVDQAAEAYAKGAAARVLPFVGYRPSGLGLTAIASYWLTGDVTTQGFLRGGDTVLEGGPYRICPQAKKPGLKVMLNQRLVQAGAAIVKSGMDAAVIAYQNQLTNEQVQGFTDPALDLIPFTAGGDSKVDFIVIDGRLYLEIKVSKM
jgi:hypothetical protein